MVHPYPPLRRCASASDAPSTRARSAWLQPDQSVPGSKCVRWASHGLDGKAATANVWKRIAAKEHQIRVTLVDPKGDFCFSVRIAEFHTSEAIRVALKVCKCMVELCRADLFRLSKIVLGSLYGFLLDRKATLVGPQDRSPRYVQNQTIDSCGPKSQIGMGGCRGSWPLSAPGVRYLTT